MKRIGSVSGFTIFELIVALAITTIIALFIFTFSISLTKLWSTSKARIETDLDAQIVLDRIAMDLESAIFQEREVPMFAVSTIAESEPGEGEYAKTHSTRWVNPKISGAGRLKEMHFDPATHRYGWGGVWLRFFSSQPSVNAIAYQIIRRPAFSNSEIPGYLLHRSVVRHDYTIEAGFDITDSAYSGSGSSDVDAYTIAKPWVSLVLAENVVDFGVRLYVFDADAPVTDDTPAGLRLIFPSTDDLHLDNLERQHIANTDFGTSSANLYPDVIEVFIRVLNDTGADALQYSEDVENLVSYESIVEEYSRVYRRMIRIPGRGAEG